MRVSRRAVIVGVSGIAALGCGAGPVAPPRPPRPSAPDPSPVARGEPGRLFRPTVPAERVALVAPPAWFARSGGLWCPAPASAGGSLLTFVERGGVQALCRQIRSFDELPALFERGRALGTDVVYLVDYYEGAPGADCTDAWKHKGTYVARADLGGPEALKRGIRAVQAKGGRVVLYVEPFVINMETDLGRRSGQAWSIRTKQGYPDDPYPGDWKICPANPAFVDHMLQVVRRTVGEYGADGLHLDSYGNQRGWTCVEQAHGHRPGEVFDAGCRALVERMFTEARRLNPEAVLLCEGGHVPELMEHVSACQTWGIHAVMERWCWSTPGSVATAGWSIEDLHQVVALGQRLALAADAWSEAPKGTLAAYYRENPLAGLGARKEARTRRFAAEPYFRAIHRFRNAAILLGRPVPDVDAATPRRGERQEAFKSDEALLALLAEGEALAPRVDAALAGAGPLPSPTAYVRKLVDAAARLAPVVRGARVTPLDVGRPHVAAWRFEGPNGVAVTAVSVDAEPVSIELPELPPRAVEVVQGDPGRTLPPHSVRVWLPG